jgi:hypothetical protein
MGGVVARVRLDSTTRNSAATTITLTPVSGGADDPNKTWSKYTPSGKIELAITVPSTADFFEFGKFYDVTFTEATDV